MEASPKILHADPLSPPKLYLVLPHVIELVLVIGHQFTDQDNVLADTLGLAKLDAGTSSNGMIHRGCLPSRIGPITPLANS